jgi:hypothetical protein
MRGSSAMPWRPRCWSASVAARGPGLCRGVQCFPWHFQVSIGVGVFLRQIVVFLQGFIVVSRVFANALPLGP